MGYKPSRYNFFFKAEDGTHLAFNTMKGVNYHEIGFSQKGLPEDKTA